MSGNIEDLASSPVTAAPSGSFPAPPVTSAAMALPFGELSWENFERLCYRLAQKVAQIDEVKRYGRQGQAQQGIDVFARKANGRYEVWQAKRHIRAYLAPILARNAGRRRPRKYRRVADRP